MLVPHQDAIEGPQQDVVERPQQDVVEGPQPMEGEFFSCHLGNPLHSLILHLLEFFFANTLSLMGLQSIFVFMVRYTIHTVRAIAWFFDNHNFYAWFLPL